MFKLVERFKILMKGEKMKKWIKKILRKAVEALLLGIIQILIAYILYKING